MAKAKGKANGNGAAAPAPGDNSEVSAEAILAFFAAEADLERKIADLNKARREMRKKMRAAGITMAEWDAMKRLIAVDQDERRAKMRHLAHLCAVVRAPLGFQFDLFAADNVADAFDAGGDDEKRKAAIADAAQSDGFRAGLANVSPKDNPHDGNTEAGQRWLKGHAEGLERRAHESVDPLADVDMPAGADAHPGA